MIGKTVAGRYSLVRLLGDGGMGAVYKAEDNVLRRFVAVKLLHPAAAANPAAVERFLREAQSAASIGHPNIIDILDFGESEGKPYLVMEYLRGRSLADQLATDGPFSIRQACAIATHALAGLQGAHDRGILHRDLKPANLMLVARFGDRTFVKLLDFGFAALLGEETTPGDRSLTPARTLVGTPAYAAPERLRGDDRRDPRTDLYALGVVLFEMLAGVRPFDATTFSELARKVQNDPPPALRLYRPDAPEALERVIVRALAKRPEERFADAESFAAALVPFGGRMVENDDSVSDSLSTDLLKIRARERRQAPTGQTQPPPRAGGAQPRARAALKTDSDDLAIDRLALDVGPQGLARGAETREQSARAPAQEHGKAAPAAREPAAKPATKPAASPPAAVQRLAATPGKAGASPLPPLPRRPSSRPPSSFPEETVRMKPAPFLPLDGAGPPPAPPLPVAPSASRLEPPPVPRSPAPQRLDPPPLPGRAAASKPAAKAGDSRRIETRKRAAPHTPADSDADGALGRRREAEASVGLAILRFASHRYGERSLAAVLNALPEEARAVFSAGLSPGTWISFDSMWALVEAIDRNLGRDDLHLVADCGRAVAEGTAERLHAPGQPFPPPELLLAEMPRYLGTTLRGVRCRVRSIGRGYGRIELDELSAPPSLTLCVMVLGILDRTLGRFGAREVEVNLLNCRYLGDDENLFDISWLIT